MTSESELRSARRWEVEELVALSTRPADIVKTICEQYGVAERTALKDISLAKKRIEARASHDVDKERAKQIRSLEAFIRIAAEKGDVAGGVSALRQLSKITGTGTAQRASSDALAHLAEVAARSIGAAVGGAVAYEKGRRDAAEETRVVEAPVEKERKPKHFKDDADAAAMIPIGSNGDVHLPETMTRPPENPEIKIRERGVPTLPADITVTVKDAPDAPATEKPKGGGGPITVSE